MKKLQRKLLRVLMPPRPNARTGRRAWAFAIAPALVTLMASGIAGALDASPAVQSWLWVAVCAIHPVWLAYTVQWSFVYFVAVSIPAHLVAVAILVALYTSPGQPPPDPWGLAAVGIWTFTLPLGAILTAAFSITEGLWMLRGKLD